MHIVKIDTRRIVDWTSFHDVFKEAFGFPEFYGNNMNAWIDCLTSLTDPEAGMTDIQISRGEVVVLQLDYVAEFSRNCREQYDAIVECCAFVNWRRLEMRDQAVLALSFSK